MTEEKEMEKSDKWVKGVLIVVALLLVIMGMIQADKAPSDAREIQTEAASGRGNT